jgi:hypothetical protein
MSIVDNAWFFVVVLSLGPSGHHVEICRDFNVMGFCCDWDYHGFQTRLSLQTPLARYCQGCGASLKPAPYTFRDRCVTSRSVFVAPGRV